MAKKSHVKPPFDANDTPPFMFISYKHADKEIVYPIIKRFNDEGFNVWYDDGLQYGEDYDDLIDLKITESSLFVICITKRVIDGAYDSKEYMKKELAVAIDTETKILPIFLDDVSLEGKYRIHLKSLHSILRHKHENEDEFIEECVDAFVDDFGFESNKSSEFENDDLKEDIDSIHSPLPDHETPPIENNFKYLDNLIKDKQEITLESDITFNDIGFHDGIEIKKDNLIINGAGHTIDADAKARIFKISSKNVTLKNINFVNGAAESGGALLINQSSDLTVDSCTFKNNHAHGDGGAILNRGYVKISKSILHSNNAENRGGAIKNAEVGNMDIYDSEFNNNNSIDGGAIINLSEINIYNTSFFKNKTKDTAGVLINFRDCKIKNCDFNNNITNSHINGDGGGALFNYKGGFLEITDSVFENNYSNLSGGAILNYQGQVLIYSSNFVKNNAKNEGNSIMNSEKGSVKINRSQFDETESKEIFSEGEIEFIENCQFKEDEEAKKSINEMELAKNELLSRIDSYKNSTNPPARIVEKLAERIYEKYKSIYEPYLAGAFKKEINEGRIPDSFFGRLDNFELKKNEFRKEAKIRLKGIYSIGYEVVSASDENEDILSLEHHMEIEELAKFNHYQWCSEKLDKNFEYLYNGTGFNDLLVRDAGLATSRKSNRKTLIPYTDTIVLWEELDEKEKRGNIDFVKEIFELLPKDLKIIKSKMDIFGIHYSFRDSNSIIYDIAEGIYSVMKPNENFSEVSDETYFSYEANAIRALCIAKAAGGEISSKKCQQQLDIKEIKNFKNLVNAQELYVSKLKNLGWNHGYYDYHNKKIPLFSSLNDGEENIMLKTIEYVQKSGFSFCKNSDEDIPEPSAGLKEDKTDNDITNHAKETDLFAKNYSFRNPNSIIYNIAKEIYSNLGGNSIKDFSEITDEEYCYLELLSIGVLCIAEAAGGSITSKKCQQPIDIEELKNSKNLVKANELLSSKLKSIGWKDGEFDVNNKTCPLFTFNDKDQQFMIETIDTIEGTRFSFCKKDYDSSTNKNIIPKAYSGDEPYIYVSYAHKDADKVFPEIKRFNNQGYNIWFDEGIISGNEWVEVIEKALSNCSLFVVFISNNSIESINVRNEISVAIRMNKPIIPIYIEDTDLKYGLALSLSNIQSIYKYQLSEEKYISTYINAFKNFGIEPKGNKTNNQKPTTDSKKKGLMSRLFGRK